MEGSLFDACSQPSGDQARKRGAFTRDTRATHARHMSLLPTKKSRRNDMADDPLQDLEKARAALVAKRLAWAKIIAAPGEISQGAISAIIEVQQAVDVIDRAIEELEETEEEDDDE
jgi:hypothetical protein